MDRAGRRPAWISQRRIPAATTAGELIRFRIPVTLLHPREQRIVTWRIPDNVVEHSLLRLELVPLPHRPGVFRHRATFLVGGRGRARKQRSRICRSALAELDQLVPVGAHRRVENSARHPRRGALERRRGGAGASAARPAGPAQPPPGGAGSRARVRRSRIAVGAFGLAIWAGPPCVPPTLRVAAARGPRGVWRTDGMSPVPMAASAARRATVGVYDGVTCGHY